MDYPKLRPGEAIGVVQDGRQMVCLRDPAHLAPEMLLLPADVFAIARLFDGKNSILDIQAAYTRQFGRERC